MRLPEQFLQKMRQLLAEDYALYEESLQKPRWCGLRVNTLKISVEEFLKITPFSLRPIPWAENGFYFQKEEDVTRHPHYFAGLYYVQEPSAMIPAGILPVAPGETVLDLCAAPGGKATELGAKLGRRGLLVANDISASRAKGLLKNLELSGIGNVLVTSETPQRLLECFPAFFDKVLIDAPCSGEGMFRKDSAMAADWEERGPGYYAKIQREILDAAAGMVKPGGRIVYSTCTFDPEENEKNVQLFLERHCEFELEAVPQRKEGFEKGRTKETGNKEMEKCVRIWPHRADGEGHFAALMKKNGQNEAQKKAGEHGGRKPQSAGKTMSDLPQEAKSFFAQIKIPLLEQGILKKHGEKLYLLPQEAQNVSRLRFLRTGLYLGDIGKNRFQPSQALAMYLKADEYAQPFSMDAEDIRVHKYLKGETIEAPECPFYKGFVLICADGYPLGWAKAVNGSLRNKYYAGWRMQ